MTYYFNNFTCSTTHRTYIHEDTHILHILHSWCGCWIIMWIDLHLNFYLPGTMPSLLDIAPLYNTICNFAWLDWGIKFTAGYPYWCKPVGRPGNHMFLSETRFWSWTINIHLWHTTMITTDKDVLIFFWRHMLAKLSYSQLTLPGGHQKEF